MNQPPIERATTEEHELKSCERRPLQVLHTDSVKDNTVLRHQRVPQNSRFVNMIRQGGFFLLPLLQLLQERKSKTL